LEQHEVINEFRDAAELGKEPLYNISQGFESVTSSLMICPRHKEARKVAAIVRQQLKPKGAIVVSVTGHERRVRLKERCAQVTAFFLSGIDPVPIW
jgi:hypothetical protein